MSDAILSATAIPDVAVSAAMVGAPRNASPAQAVREFESLFVETLLQHSGLAQALQGGEALEGGMAGELLLHELARSLADQLKLGFGKSLGVEGAQ
jgi:hypothetical protein